MRKLGREGKGGEGASMYFFVWTFDNRTVILVWFRVLKI